jgi:hypothetical protein
MTLMSSWVDTAAGHTHLVLRKVAATAPKAAAMDVMGLAPAGHSNDNAGHTDRHTDTQAQVQSGMGV